ncbi:MAG: hypothetical protein ACRDHZ_23810 [Ktedonobacteraceae bacterium]
MLGRGPYDDLHRNFRTGGAWWAGVKKGWSETSVVLILHAVTGDSTLVGDHLSEHEWQESMWYRPELKYNPQMTDAQAEVNAQNLNDRIKGVLFQASHSSVYGLGATLGALCDPLFLLILLFLGFELFRDRRLPKPIKYWLSGIGVLAGTTLRIISAPIWFPIKVGKKQAPKDRSKDEPPSL